MRCAIWYHLHSLKNVRKHPWRSVTFSKVAGEKPETLLKVTLLDGCFSRFLIVDMVPNRAKHDNVTYIENLTSTACAIRNILFIFL